MACLKCRLHPEPPYQRCSESPDTNPVGFPQVQKFLHHLPRQTELGLRMLWPDRICALQSPVLLQGCMRSSAANPVLYKPHKPVAHPSSLDPGIHILMNQGPAQVPEGSPAGPSSGRQHLSFVAKSAHQHWGLPRTNTKPPLFLPENKLFQSIPAALLYSCGAVVRAEFQIPCTDLGTTYI